jgi:hypothetical protein
MTTNQDESGIEKATCFAFTSYPNGAGGWVDEVKKSSFLCGWSAGREWANANPPDDRPWSKYFKKVNGEFVECDFVPISELKRMYEEIAELRSLVERARYFLTAYESLPDVAEMIKDAEKVMAFKR